MHIYYSHPPYIVTPIKHPWNTHETLKLYGLTVVLILYETMVSGKCCFFIGGKGSIHPLRSNWTVATLGFSDCEVAACRMFFSKIFKAIVWGLGHDETGVLLRRKGIQ